ncbi:MAG: alpha-L-rhamnosidase C-terminal domain-containing protein, partial [bacterium]
FYEEKSSILRASLRHDYFAPGGRCVCDTQTGLLLSLRYGLTPDPEACCRRLKEKLQMAGGLQTGFVGTPFLTGELCRGGLVHEAWDLLLNEDYPGWLYEVKLGATTVWERWNSLGPDGKVSSTGMNSFNHYSYGAIAGWLYSFAAGLSPLVPGFKEAQIAPCPDLRIGHVDMTYRSAAGTYHIFWEAEDDRHLRLSVTIPFGCRARVVLPCSGKDPLELTAGTYEWSYETTEPLRRVFCLDQPVKELLLYPAAVRVLEDHVPGITSLPDAMKGYDVRQILQMPPCGPMDSKKTEDLDMALRKVI